MWWQRSARSWLLEVSLALLAAALGLFFVLNPTEGPGAPVAVEAGAGALCFAAMVLFRREWPVALTLGLIPTGILLGLPMGFTPIALFAVALHRPGRVTIALAALHAVLVTVTYGLALGLVPVFYESVAFLVLMHVSVIAVAMLIRSHRLLVRSWADRALHAEEGQRLRIEQARLAERERIAREMHDVLAHRISLMAVHAGALAVRRDASAAERQAAEVIRQCAHDGLEDLRSVIGMLRAPAEDRPQPTLGDVPALVEQSRSAGARVGLSDAGLELAEGAAVPEQMGRHAYRIIQEALTNARKHAPGALVRVEISGAAARGLDVRVDNVLAPSLAAIPGSGAGLAGLRERVHLVGGRIEHGPTPAGEFHVRAWLPWQA